MLDVDRQWFGFAHRKWGNSPLFLFVVQWRHYITSVSGLLAGTYTVTVMDSVLVPAHL